MTGSACFESVDCAPTSPLCGGYAEEAVFTAPADGTYYAMGHSLSVYGSSGFDYRVFAPGGAYQYNGPWDTLAADADITDLAGLSLTVRTWPPPEPRLPLTQTINCDMKTALPTHNLGSFCLDFVRSSPLVYIIHHHRLTDTLTSLSAALPPLTPCLPWPCVNNFLTVCVCVHACGMHAVQANERTPSVEMLQG